MSYVDTPTSSSSSQRDPDTIPPEGADYNNGGSTPGSSRGETEMRTYIGVRSAWTAVTLRVEQEKQGFSDPTPGTPAKTIKSVLSYTEKRLHGLDGDLDKYQ